MSKIKFLYFESCPNAKPTLENLEQALKELNLNVEIEKLNVDTEEKAKQTKFLGSPSIYVNDLDLYTEKVPESSFFGCRTFQINQKLTGVLDKDFIKNKLQKLLNT